jgi:nucleoside-triphosphatase
MVSRGKKMQKNLFITGRIRSGKSTLLRTMLEPLLHITGGYFVQRLFIDGESRAFRLADITKESYLPDRHVKDLAGINDLIAVMGQEKCFNYDTFRTIGVDSLTKACRQKQIVVMDELGRIETRVPEFMQAVFETLDSDIPTLGVIKKESNPFLDQIRARADVDIIDMDNYTADLARNQVQHFLAARIS